MNNPSDESDPAAVFGCALSLWNACNYAARADSKLNISEAYQGIDQLMREVMSAGRRFEAWACSYVAFDELEDVWPYMLEDKFGAACIHVINPSDLAGFDDDDCLRVALQLGLPVKAMTGLPVPVDIAVANPVVGSVFVAFRILTVRNDLEDHSCEVFKEGDEPFDENFGAPYFALYGVDRNGVEEHLTDRSSYAEASDLCRRLFPGIDLPNCPVAVKKKS